MYTDIIYIYVYIYIGVVYRECVRVERENGHDSGKDNVGFRDHRRYMEAFTNVESLTVDPKSC